MISQLLPLNDIATRLRYSGDLTKKPQLLMRLRHISILSLISSLALMAGCSQPASKEAVSPSSGSAANSAEIQNAQTTNRISTPGNTPATRTSTTSASEVPLTPGIYVVQGESCRNPANAGWRGWNGDGLVGSSTRNCRAMILSRSGDDYRLRNSCENTYDGSRSDETFTMTVTDQVHFTIKGQRFASCSTAQVPSSIRNHVFPRATADTPVNSENYAQVMEARSREYERLEYKPVNLRSRG